MLISILFLDIKKPAFAGFFMTPISVLENGARGRTRTGTLCGRGILNPLCLPISPPGLFSKFGGGGRNRTGVHGVAVRCMTTLPPRLHLVMHILATFTKKTILF